MHLIRRCFILTRCVNAVGSKQTFRRPLTGKADSNLLRKGDSSIETKPRKSSKRARKDCNEDIEDIHKSLWKPDNWETVLENIRLMRKNRDAPVDSMGAEKCADQDAPPKVRRFQILVSLMLSSQTKDQVTYSAMQNLKKYGLTVEKIKDADEEVIAKLIHPVGFWKKKASYIKRTAAVLIEKFDGDIPKTVEEMCKNLPGVGQKMAVLTVNIAWNTTVGIGVDIHVHRISNRLGWTEKPTKTPEQTQAALEKWIPPSLWGEINHLMVGFGQQTCSPVKPNCSKCLNRDLCAFGKNNKAK